MTDDIIKGKKETIEPPEIFINGEKLEIAPIDIFKNACEDFGLPKEIEKNITITFQMKNLIFNILSWKIYLELEEKETELIFKGFWAEAIDVKDGLSKLYSQGDTIEELKQNIKEATACHFGIDIADIELKFSKWYEKDDSSTT